MTADDTVPQADPRAAYLAQRTEIDAAIAGVLMRGRYILGDEVAAFEREFAAFQDAAHGVAVASGTAALELGLRAAGVGRGDLVATVSHTAVATVAAIELVGAEPVLLDIDDTYCLDPAAFGRAAEEYGAALRAVVPVHLYGEPADMARIGAIAGKRGIAILEDCAQAHGARLGGLSVGKFGAVAAYSLYPTKNLGAIGDGGILTTDDAAVAARLRSLREYGWGAKRYVSDAPGDNSRLDEVQAAILRVKLRRLAADNARRREIAGRYDEALAETPIERPRRRPGSEPVFHQYVVAHRRRDVLRRLLDGEGIGTNIHYPVPVHLQPAYAGRVKLGEGGCPRTEAAAERILSLPIYPQMSDAAVERVCAALRRSAKEL